MVVLKAEVANWFDIIGTFKNRNDAEREMLKRYDTGIVTDFIIEEDGAHYCYPAYKLYKEDCPRCGKESRPYKMIRTRDCHGIPFRLVCEKCYDAILNGPGYDGEYYDESDECLDYDY